MLGPWWGRGEDDDAVTVFDGIKAQNPNTTFEPGCTLSNHEPPQYDPAQRLPVDRRLRRGEGRRQRRPTRSCSRSARRAR